MRLPVLTLNLALTAAVSTKGVCGDSQSGLSWASVLGRPGILLALIVVARRNMSQTLQTPKDAFN